MKILREYSILNINIKECYDESKIDQCFNYTSHFEVYYNNKKLLEDYFDLETAYIAGIVYSVTQSTQTSIELTHAIRNMIGLNLRPLTEIINTDGDEMSDGECLDAIMEHYKIEMHP